jgi:hypothetical protein
MSWSYTMFILSDLPAAHFSQDLGVFQEHVNFEELHVSYLLTNCGWV